jgi:hypothetical protein
MTTRLQMAEMVATQERVIAALREGGDERLADRLAHCLRARIGRRLDDGWPWTCRSAGCSWCRKTTMSPWWTGIQRFIATKDGPVSLAMLPLSNRPGELRAAVVRQRRAVRDVRDRAGRWRSRWRGVAVAGMASGDNTTLLLIRHTDIGRAEVGDVLCRRWPDVVLRDVAAALPCWDFTIEDAVELGRARRGVEPLRIVVLPQRFAAVGAPQHVVGYQGPTPIEPMPIVL